MSEMIERVQRVIDATDRQDMTSRDAARAAIKAMRKPTPAMIKAFYRSDEAGAPTTATEGWQAMIDAALKETAEK